MKKQEVKVKTIGGIRNAILMHKRVWLTKDGKEWVYAQLKKDGKVFVNYGLSADTRSLHDSIWDIDYFLNFQKSINLLG